MVLFVKPYYSSFGLSRLVSTRWLSILDRLLLRGQSRADHLARCWAGGADLVHERSRCSLPLGSYIPKSPPSRSTIAMVGDWLAGGSGGRFQRDVYFLPWEEGAKRIEVRVCRGSERCAPGFNVRNAVFLAPIEGGFGRS